MAYTNFKPEIWSHKIQHDLPKFTVFEQDCNYQFKGEVKQGATVHILGVSKPKIGDYNGSSIGSPEVFEGTKQTLVIDQAKYFNFGVDDVDDAQSIPGLMEAYMEESTRAMAEQRDSFIAKLASGATHVSASTTIGSKAAAKGAIDAAITALISQGVKLGRDNITMYLNPEVWMYMADYIVETKSKNDQALATGVLGNYMGVKIKVSNNIYNDGTDDYLMVKTDKAIAFASNINKVEAYRPEDLFMDAVKGLNCYGGKIVRPNELYVIKHKISRA